MDIANEIINSISYLFQVKEDDIHPNNRKEDFEKWDSIGHLQLVMHLEEKFGIQLSTEDITEMDSVQKCIEIVSSYKNEAD